MPRSALAVPLLVVALVPAAAAWQEASVDAVIREYTVGRAEPVISSTLDVRPQIAIEPSTPYPRVVPIHKLEAELPGFEEDGRPAGERTPQEKGGFGWEGTSQTPWVPPDPTIAVGPGHVLMTVNMNVAWWDRQGNLQFSQRLDSSGSPGFFEDVGAGSFTFDPKCVYDEHSGRFFVLALEVYGSSQTAWITFAVSDDSDPNGVWYKYRTDAVTWVGSNSFWVDYPGLGYDDQAFYVTGNLFGLSAGGFAGAKYRVLPKAPLLSGGTATWFDFRDGTSASVQAAVCHTPPLAGFFTSSRGSRIRVQAITDPTTNPVLWTSDVPVAAWSGPPSAPNLGGGFLDTLDGRVINADYRDATLVTGHGVGVNGVAAARWYQIATGAWPRIGSLFLVQQGDLQPGAGQYTWFPALALNQDGDIGLVSAHSSATAFAGIVYARHQPGDPPGVMKDVKSLMVGSAGTSGRWGDYFDCQIDPLDDTTFWGTGEIAEAGGWTTWIGSFDFQAIPSQGFLFASRDAGVYAGVAFAKGDVVSWDSASGRLQVALDLSDVVPGAVLTDALCLLSDGSLLLSFGQDEVVPGLAGGPEGDLVRDEDLVQFLPSSLGSQTAGTFVFYFDGSDVGLDTKAEDVDAVSVAASGDLFLSFTGPFSVPGVSGKDEDVVVFQPATLGANTSGTFTLLVDASEGDMRLGGPGEDVDALSISPFSGALTLSTAGIYSVPGLSGDSADLIEFLPQSLGSNPTGTWSLFFDCTAFGDLRVTALHRIE